MRSGRGERGEGRGESAKPERRLFAYRRAEPEPTVLVRRRRSHVLPPLPSPFSLLPLFAAALALIACTPVPKPEASGPLYGTREPFASEAIYFVVTDRFVNGDPGNDHRDQGQRVGEDVEG